MKKRLLAIALTALAFGGLCYAKKAKKDGSEVQVQESQSEQKPAKENKAKKEKEPKKQKENKKEKKQNKNKAQDAGAGEAAEQTAAQDAPAANSAAGSAAESSQAPQAAAQTAPQSAAAPAAAESSANSAAGSAEQGAAARAALIPAQDQDDSQDTRVSAVIKRIGGDVALHDGLARLETVRASGAVLFFVANGKKNIPALKTSEYGQSNYISIFSGAKEYRLNKNGHCSYSYDVNSNSITETLQVKDVVEVVATYQLDKYSPKDTQTNCVRVKLKMRNLADKKAVLALKAVYNLCLGENRQAHYSTAANKAIGSEYVLVPSREEGWVISSDGQNAIEFVLYGKGVTPPKKAAMANKDVIDLATPITLFNPGNTFNSILSYNDSAMALFWEPVELAKDANVTYSFVVNFSDSDFQNSGKEIFEDPKAAADDQESNDGALEQGQKGAMQSVGGLDSTKLNMEYVQQLINHINSLQRSDPSLNAAKIQQLQTEVDEVLQVLRSRK